MRKLTQETPTNNPEIIKREEENILSNSLTISYKEILIEKRNISVNIVNVTCGQKIKVNVLVPLPRQL